jgi:hypothetical protein
LAVKEKTHLGFRFFLRIDAFHSFDGCVFERDAELGRGHREISRGVAALALGHLELVGFLRGRTLPAGEMNLSFSK